MGKPTLEEYNKALENKELLRHCISMERKSQDELLDKLLNSRELLKDYKK